MVLVILWSAIGFLLFVATTAAIVWCCCKAPSSSPTSPEAPTVSVSSGSPSTVQPHPPPSFPQHQGQAHRGHASQTVPENPRAELREEVEVVDEAGGGSACHSGQTKNFPIAYNRDKLLDVVTAPHSTVVHNRNINSVEVAAVFNHSNCRGPQPSAISGAKATSIDSAAVVVSKAKSDYPAHFVSLRNVTSLPGKAMRHHIFTPSANWIPGSIVRSAEIMSEKRSRHIVRNTVFCAPRGWHAWDTKRGPRTASSERVYTVQCERRGGRGAFVGEMVGMKYAIFRNDHLMVNESLSS